MSCEHSKKKRNQQEQNRTLRFKCCTSSNTEISPEFEMNRNSFALQQNVPRPNWDSRLEFLHDFRFMISSRLGFNVELSCEHLDSNTSRWSSSFFFWIRTLHRSWYLILDTWYLTRCCGQGLTVGQSSDTHYQRSEVEMSPVLSFLLPTSQQLRCRPPWL